jgi:hypothetical protein
VLDDDDADAILLSGKAIFEPEYAQPIGPDRVFA